MPTIDERVVSMAFENAAFEQRVATTMASLAKLDASIKTVGQAQGLSNLEADSRKVTLDTPMSALDKLKEKLGGVNSGAAFSNMERDASRVSFNPLTSAVDGISSHFSAMEVAVGVTLGNILSRAIQTAAGVAKSLTLDPVTAGFHNYETQINAVQTILANTGKTGKAGLNEVNQSLGQLNTYANQTVYNFSEMAKNIGTFTAAGVKLQPATDAIKGIANLAALSGSNSQQASTAMYQLSQAIAAGQVHLQDWNSVVNAGMGGKVFQKALFDTGKAMGTITNSPVGQTFAQWEKAGNSFRQSLSATHKAATDGTSALKTAQKDAAKQIADAHSQAADAIASATERVKSAQKAEAEAVISAAQKVKDAEQQAADDTKAAADRVAEAHRNVRDTAQQASKDIAAAVSAQKDQIIQSASDVAAALQSVVEARQRLADAMKPPSADALQAATDNLTTAQLDQADLANAITLAQREQERSSQDLANAEKHLADLRAAGASSDQIQQATRAVEDAQVRAADAADAVTRATLKQNAATRGLHDAEQQLTDTKNKGTDADKNVKDARDALTVATDKYAAAQKKAQKDDIAAAQAVRDAKKKAYRDEQDAHKALTDAEKKQSEVRIKARQAVDKAVKDQRDTIVKAADDVAKAEKDQAKTIKDSREQEASTIEQATARIKAARDSLKGPQNGPPSWLTADVLTNTLRQFTGDMTKAQLKAQGFTDAQANQILKIGKVAVDSATKIKTITQLFEALKEEVGTAWANTFKILFGNINQAKTTFSALHVFMENALTAPINSFNKVLAKWAKLGGRKDLLDGIKNAFKALMGVIDPIRHAFRDIFPPLTAKNLLDLTQRFKEFTATLMPSQTTMDNLRRTFRGVFAVMHTGLAIVKGLAGVLFGLFGTIGSGSGGFLKFTGHMGDMAVAMDNALTKGGILKKFFNTLGAILKVPIALISDLANAIKRLFGHGTSDEPSKFASAMGAVGASLKPLAAVASKVTGEWDKLKNMFSGVTAVVAPLVSGVANALKGIGGAIANSFQSIDVNKVLLALQTGLLAGIVVYLRKFFSGGLKINVGGGVLTKVKEALGGLTSTLAAVQRNLQASTLLKIGAAIGILALAIILLSTIKPEPLKKALAAIAVGIAELVGAMAALTKVAGAGSFIQLPAIAAGMLLLAGAMLVLAGAMKIFATMNWQDIAKGLVGVGGSLAAVGLGMKLVGATRLIPIAAGMILIGVALNIMAAAMKIFATMKWEDIGKGLAGIAGGLVAIGTGLLFMGPSLIFVGPGLLATAFAITIMAGAIALFGKMSLETIGKGIFAIAAAVVTLGIALIAMPPGPYLIGQGAGLVVVATALGILAGALAIMGKIKLFDLVKGIGALAASLVILAVGLTLMAGTIPGTIALLGAAAALAILAPTLAFLGQLDWGTIFKGLTAIALVLGTLAVVGLLVAPAIAALGIALIPLGLGLLAIAGAIFVASAGIALLGDQGPKAIAAVSLAITALVTLLPTMIINFITGLVTIVEEIAKVAPKVALALGVIIDTILATIIQAAPKVAEAVGALIVAFVDVITNHSAELIAAGLTLLVNFLTGIANNIGKVVESVGSIIVNFLNALTSKLPEIITSGANLLIQFLNGIIHNLGRVVSTVATLVATFLNEITKRLPLIIAKGAQLIITFLNAIAAHVPGVIRAGVNVIVAYIDGIGNALPRIIAAGVRVIRKFMDGMSTAIPELVDAGFKAIIRLLNGIERAIRQNSKQLRDAGWGVMSAIIDGMLGGLTDLWHKVTDMLHDMLSQLPKAARKLLGIASPSTVFHEIGVNTMQGLTNGIKMGGDASVRAVGDVSDNVIRTASDTFGKIPDALANITDMQPTITPVLDLSLVKKEAKNMPDLGAPEVAPNVVPITAAASFNAASSISSGETARAASLNTTGAGMYDPRVINFQQNNYSPKALSDIEIYRQTRNQLGNLRKSLGVD